MRQHNFRFTDSEVLMRKLLIALVMAPVAATTLAAQASQQPVYLTPYGPPTRPFSPATRVGNVIYLAGQIGTAGANASAAAVVPGGIEAETRQTLNNIKEVLEKVGSDMDHVFKCTVMMADMKEWDTMNGVYRTFFKPDRMPARSALGANGLALNARVEIECLATVK